MTGKPRQLFFKDGTPVLDSPGVIPNYDDIAWPPGHWREIFKHPKDFDEAERRSFEDGFYPFEVEYFDEAYGPVLKFAVARSFAKWTP